MIDLFLLSAFEENLALSFFLGICTFLAVSRSFDTAVGLGIAMVFVLAITVPINHVIYHSLLTEGAWSWAGLPDADISFLKLLCFISVIAAIVQILEMLLDRFFAQLHRRLGIYLPLLTVNCAILGASLFMVERQYTLAESIVYAVGSGAGWALAIISFAAIRERLHYSDVPRGLQGLGIAFVVTGLLSLGFSSFAVIGGVP